MKNSLSLHALSIIADRLRGAQQRSRTDLEINKLLAKLCHHQYVFGIKADFSFTNYRARRLRTDEALQNVRQVIYPPDPPKEAGRANLPNTRVLYASSEVRVALDETEASKGDRFGVAWIRVRDKLLYGVQVIGEIESIANRGSSLIRSRENEDEYVRIRSDDPVDFEKAYFVDAVLAQLFRRDSRDYQVTSLVAHNCFVQNRGIINPANN